MKKIMSFMLIVFGILAISEAAVFADVEKIVIGSDEMYGCFSKPCTVNPGETNLYYNAGFGGKVATVYYFYGRTGDKTFDVRRKSTGTFGEDHIYHYYFVPNDTVDIQYVGGIGKDMGCGPGDNVLLKFIELTGNRLTYQIILPNCLKKLK